MYVPSSALKYADATRFCPHQISFRSGCNIQHPYMLIPDYLPSKWLECLLKDPDAYHSKMQSLWTVCSLSLTKSY